MNILILAKESHVGGLLQFTCNLAQGLSKKSDTKVVIGITPSNANEPLKPYNLNEIDFETKSPFKILSNYRKLSRIIKEYEIDIIQAQNRVVALYAWIYCSFHRKVKYIWACLVTPIPSSFLYRITTKYGECVVTGPEDVKMLVEALKIPEERVKGINLGIDFSKFSKTTVEEQKLLINKLGIADDEKVILLYGRLDKIKGHEYLLQSLRLVKKANYKVVFPGDNQEYKNYLINLIRDYKLEGRVIFPGYIKGNEFLSITDLMVLPSEKDGICFAFLESIYMGVPVIKTKNAGYADIKDMCFGVDYGDVESLAKLIDDFLSGDVKFQKRAELAKKESNRFGIDNMVNEYYNLYSSIV